MIVIPIVAALLAAGWWWTTRDTGEGGPLVLYGNVDVRQVSLAFDGSGRILDLTVEEGDDVVKGEVLGTLDTRSLELQGKQAEAEVEVQRQKLLSLRNGTRPEEIAQIKAQIASAEATMRRAQRDYERMVRLATGGSAAVSAQNVEHAKSESEAADAKVQELQAALQLAVAGPRAEDIAAAEAALAAAEANVALLRHEIDQGTLRAPVDAVVRSRLLQPGDQATPQQPVFALAITAPKWARVYVNEPDLGRIRPGMKADIFTDTAPDHPISGQVGYISSVAEFTPKAVQTEELRTSLVYEVRVIVEDAADTLRLGQPVTVRFPPDAAS
ncbi:HlyD family efflux transporter periplasmic adaptor subunit [Acuticoccus kandeliae]|uniref:HlyD family efflux transporter periplasmic adaptor subunit n=1 Tax=Acuticoccus kandeliae TaxID=2073160 RepID=UPI001FEA0098|nr:HlyD family efflux transporter periplasmic adaptor subunit [Acuticoccus kandeliae]